MRSSTEKSNLPHFLLFSGPEASFDGFIKWLSKFPCEDIGFRLLNLEGSSTKVWVVGVEGLRSAMPLSDSLREMFAPGVRGYAPVHQGTNLDRPAGTYHTWPLPRSKTRSKGMDVNGSRTILLQDHQQAWPIPLEQFGQFERLPLQVEGLLDRDVRDVSVEVPIPPPSIELAVRLERHTAPPIETLAAKRRRVKEAYARKLRELDSAERLEGAKGGEPQILTLILEDHAASFVHLVRTLPLEVLASFLYFKAQTTDCGTLHFILPSPDAEYLHFPSLSGALQLICPNAWRAAGLTIFMDPSLRLSPPLHLRHAKQIRQILLARHREASPNSPLVFFANGGKIKRLLLPDPTDPKQGFVRLDQAIAYMNGEELEKLGLQFQERAVATFCQGLDEDLARANSKLVKDQEDMVAAAERFLDEAISCIQEKLSEFDALAERIAKLDNRKKELKDAVQKVNQQICNRFEKTNKGGIETLVGEIQSFCKDLEACGFDRIAEEFRNASAEVSRRLSLNQKP